MFEWIKSMNKMYEENSCTCNGRVAVAYAEGMGAVVIKVMDKYVVINIEEYTDWGLMNKIQDTVREMYEAV